jgi:hypothetical protein
MTEATLISLVVGLLTVAGAAGGAWGAVKYSLGTLSASVESLRDWLESVDRGDTEHMGRVSARLQRLEDDSARQYERLQEIEIRCARRGCRGEEAD